MIDLNTHEGGHPRLGAVDLIPIHPMSPDVTLADCGTVAKGTVYIFKRFNSVQSRFLLILLDSIPSLELDCLASGAHCRFVKSKPA